MKFSVSGLLVAGTLALSANAAYADALTTPAMEGPLTANATPLSFDPGFMDGPIYVTGAVTGLAQYQSNADHVNSGDGSTMVDLDNAWVSLQKTTGLFQFYVQAGLYSYPTLGQPYERSDDTTSGTFGAVPVAYAKLQLSDTFSVEAGKLPTLIGAEYANTTQNMNIERGLLWEQEPINSRGVQVNYASGPLSVSLSWNDGTYTNVWNTGSALISYAFDSANTLAVDASYTPGIGAFGLSNQIYNLIYTYNAAPFVINPYIQYQKFDTSVSGVHSENYGVGILADYQFTPTWSLAGRVEYETISGFKFFGEELGFGAKKEGYSFTVTPTWQKGIFFIRGEGSYTNVEPYVDLEGGPTGFGRSGTKDDQFRAMVETGIVF